MSKGGWQYLGLPGAQKEETTLGMLGGNGLNTGSLWRMRAEPWEGFCPLCSHPQVRRNIVP